MHDVIGAYRRLEQMYRLYIKSAFPLRSPALSEERDAVLMREGVLSQPLLIETVPVYESSQLDLAGAAARLPIEYRDLVSLAQKLFPPEIELYRHQRESLEEVIINRKDLVVTTGTGSGKTECFLLPLLAQLARESSTWKPIKPEAPDRQWWDDTLSVPRRERVSQWEHIQRPPALRAVILYPLNALVEDQLRRLRTALDNNDVHAWLDKHRGGNRITFGRYTGQTPLSGLKDNPQRVNQLRSILKDTAQQRRAVLKEIATKKLDEEVQFYFPRLDGGEMWSRWDMQETPPDILITNYSMLNIMLMRRIENDIFEQTRKWLTEPGHEEREFFLIIDELHAYRGTPGTEVAYVLRLLLSRLGLTLDSPQLRILTTTASLDEDDQGRAFLRQFFGRDRFAFIKGQQKQPSPGARVRLMSYQSAFAEFAQTIQPDPLAGPPNPDSSGIRDEMDRLASRLGGSKGNSADTRLGEALQNVRASEVLRDACQFAMDGMVRPILAPRLDAAVFGTMTSNDENVVSDAMRGLLLALGMSRQGKALRSPQPVRGHLFFHHLQNLWVCCNPNCTDAAVDQLGREDTAFGPQPSVGAIHSMHRLSCSCGSRVLDLIVCEVCGDVFLGGYRAIQQVGTKKLTVLTADQPDLENMPDRVSLGQRYKDYAVFWPLPHDPPWSVRPQDEEWKQDEITRRWVPARLSCTTGLLFQDATPPKADEIPGWLYYIPGTKGDNQPATPSKCPRCDADYRSRKTFKSSLRNHRTGFQKACQVLASALLREMSPFQQKAVSPSRKLVIFSDSRQDAAKLAAGMERDHFRDMIRLALIRALYAYWEDFVAYLRVEVEAGSPAEQMLLALNPMLHTAVTAAPQNDDTPARDRFEMSLPNEIAKEALRWTAGKTPVIQKARDAWEKLILEYPGPVPLTNLRGTIYERLIQAGICPGGSEFTAKRYRVKQGQWDWWYECYDWSPGEPQPLINPADPQRNHISRMGDRLTSELMYALFPHIARTIEGLGQGRVSYQPGDVPSPDIRSATEAVIRQMGVRRLHSYADSVWRGNDNTLRKFSLTYLQNRSLSDHDIHQQLLQSGAGSSSANGLVLNPDRLTIVPAGESNGTARQAYRCPRCNTMFLHDVGVCPECSEQTSLVADTIRNDFDYYTRLTETPYVFRMNSEELTGQTDKADRPRRQRWFQEVFLGEEIPRVHGVDLLSVTTTMEAGVDIGALNAVMMANMPPRRFNYQQRVGRAGRRSSGVSLAVTFCRGRSHDDFYYVRPEKMTGDPPPPPYVDLSSESIYKRVLIKEVLRQAFLHNPSLVVNADGDNVHGEFGLATEWDTQYEPTIRAWLQNPANRELIEKIIETLIVETPWADLTATGNAFRVRMYEYIRDDLADDITEIANNDSYIQDALSERLANAGLLPMFGFPTRVRLMYTEWRYRADNWPPETGTVDRNLDLAISQFAPGSETVKDKAVHTAVGIVNLYRVGNRVISEEGFYPALIDGNPAPLGLCTNCQAVVTLPAASSPPPGGVEPSLQGCPVCNVVALRPIDAREPKGFFTDLDPRDFDGQFEWQPRATRPSLGVTPPNTSPASAANCTIHTLYEDIISVNDNGGRGGFDFRPAQVYGKIQQGAYAVIPDDNTGTTSGASDRVTVYGTAARIALIARRKTDILLVNIDHWPKGVFADPTTVEGRAAWYSFAFWLRIAAGAHLDVDPQELQAGFRSLPGATVPVIGQAFLSDQLENGAGYCRFLGRSAEFQQLLAQTDANISGSIADKWLNAAHSTECDTSCNLCLRDLSLIGLYCTQIVETA